MSTAVVSGEIIPVPRGSHLLAVAGYVVGILLGGLFVVLWATGAAEMVLGLIGVGMVLLCLYLLPVSLGSAIKGDALIIGDDRFQYVRAGSSVLGNIPFNNVEAITINERDGGRSLWIRLQNPAADGSFWMGGLDSMNVICSQCGYHMVVGQGLPVDPKTLESRFQSKLGS